MHEFNYHTAKTISDAISTLSSSDDGVVMAGGQTLLPTLKQRLAAPSDVIDIATISDLNSITISGDTLELGALVTHASVSGSKEIAQAIPGLAKLAEGIGDPQVRNRGTVGGSIANNDPAADYPAACLALKAIIVTDQREINADEFFTGLFETALHDNELIIKVRFQIPEKGAYMKFPNPASRYALVGVFVAKGPDGVRVAVTGAGDDGVFRASALENALEGNFSEAALEGISIPTDDLIADIHASSEYRANLISVMAKRAITALV